MPLALPPPPVIAVAAVSQAERALVRAINVQRRRHGVRGLRITVSLSRVAREAARRSAGSGVLTHAGLAERLARAGADFRRAGETLALLSGGSSTARRVVRLWMRSPPHRSALLDPGFARIGVGRARDRHGTAVAATLGSLR